MELRDAIAEVNAEMYADGLITVTGGNVSARIPGTNEAWITPSRRHKGRLTAEMMTRIDMAGCPLDAGALPPSSEWRVHTAIYTRYERVTAVVHTHAPQATILMLAGLPFLPISIEAAFIGEIPRVPFIMAGTQALGDAVGEALGDGVAVLMQNHGLVVAASSLRRAADLTHAVEETARKLVACAMMGAEPQVLSVEEVAAVRASGVFRA